MMEAENGKKRQLDFLMTHVVGNRRKGRCQDNQGRYGWRMRDGSNPGFVFGQLDGSHSTVDKLR